MRTMWHTPRSSMLLLVTALLFSTALTASATDEPFRNLGKGNDSPASAPRVPYPAGAWVQDSTPSGFEFWRFGGAYFDDSSGQPYSRKVYFLGGRTAEGTTDGSIWWFDPLTGTYGRPDGDESIPTPVSNHRPVILNDGSPDGLALYVFGGRTDAGPYTTLVQVYYPKTNTTATIDKDPWPGTIGGNPTIPGDVVVYNNKAYAIGGTASAGGPVTAVSAQTWIYDPSAVEGSRWTQAQSMFKPRAYLSAAAVDDKIYAIGGDSWDGAALSVLPDVERFDPANPGLAWVARSSMPAASSGVAGCDESQAFGFDSTSMTMFAGKVLISGCGQWTYDFADGFVYDTATDSWTTGPNLNQTRRNYASALVPMPGVGWQAWVFGGRQGDDTKVLNIAEHLNLQGLVFMPLIRR